MPDWVFWLTILFIMFVCLTSCGRIVEPPPPCTQARATSADTTYWPSGKVQSIIFTCDPRFLL